MYDRIIVAGAGGGAAAHMSRCHGGAGGGLIGGNGMLDSRFLEGYCGKGGTQICGGGGAICIRRVWYGIFGSGGDSINRGNPLDEVCGGGGGAGYYGGGAGNDGGGGGGSSFTEEFTVIYVQHQQGIHTGNGKIKITY